MPGIPVFGEEVFQAGCWTESLHDAQVLVVRDPGKRGDFRGDVWLMDLD
jgi:hypothetical protein